MNKSKNKNLLIILLVVGISFATYNNQKKTILSLDDTVKTNEELINSLNDKIDELTKEITLHEKEVEDLILKNKKLEDQNKKLSKIRYDNSDLTIKSNVTQEQLYNVLEGTNMQYLSEQIVSAEKEYGVNALFLTGLIAHETGYGTSRRYREDNNVGGYEVYTVSSKGRIFDSKESSVNAVANLLSSHYLNPEGKYYNGKSSFDVNKLYCQSSPGGQFEWHKTIDSIARSLRDEINKQI